MFSTQSDIYVQNIRPQVASCQEYVNCEVTSMWQHVSA